jgi:hypothetical protein
MAIRTTGCGLQRTRESLEAHLRGFGAIAGIVGDEDDIESSVVGELAPFGSVADGSEVLDVPLGGDANGRKRVRRGSAVANRWGSPRSL